MSKRIVLISKHRLKVKLLGIVSLFLILFMTMGIENWINNGYFSLHINNISMAFIIGCSIPSTTRLLRFLGSVQSIRINKNNVSFKKHYESHFSFEMAADHLESVRIVRTSRKLPILQKIFKLKRYSQLSAKGLVNQLTHE